VVGLLGLVILSGTMMALAWDSKQFGRVALVLLVVFGGLGVGSIFILSGRLRAALRLRELAQRLPAGEHIIRVGASFVAMRHHKTLTLLSLGITVVLQALVVVSAYFMARALGMRGDFVTYFVYVPIGFLIAAIPISPPQAFGVLEWAYIQFFTRGGLGNDPSQAVALALAVRLIQLAWALPGMLVPLLGAHVPSAAELEALESGNGGFAEDALPPAAIPLTSAAAPR
jgi:hypothetical protein